jgi:hypothetical protein
VNLDMLATAKEKFAQDPAVEGKPILQLTEITMRNLLAERTDVDRRTSWPGPSCSPRAARPC